MSEIPESALKHREEVRMARKYQHQNIQDCAEDEMVGAGYVRVDDGEFSYAPESMYYLRRQLELGNTLTWSTKWGGVVIVWRKNI